MQLSFVSWLWKNLIDFVFPYICIGCRAVEGVLLCRTCMRQIVSSTNQCCPVCKTQTTHGGLPCARCKTKTSLDYLIVATADTSGIVRRLIHFYKYRFITELDIPLSGILLNSFLSHIITNESIALVPVPLHQSRHRWRGFNQASLLAKNIGSIADITVLSHVLRRTRRTRSQATLNREKRLQNLKRAFACHIRIPPHKEIVLVDDVATTCATLEHCALVLKQCGARRVGAVVISRGT